MKHKRLLALLSVCFLLSALRTGAEETRKPVGWVNDYANVISPDYRQKMTGLINELEAKTSIEIAVVTETSIAPYDEKSYARKIFDGWRIGKKGKDNGVLVLLAVSQRRWRIEVGYGVEAILPDGRCGEIGRNYMVPYFKDGRYGEGLYRGVAAIASVIAKDAKSQLDGLRDANLQARPAKRPGAADLGGMFFMYILIPGFFFLWNLPWPVALGLPVTLIFALVFFDASPVTSFLIIGAYLASLIFRYNFWRKQPFHKRGNFFGTQTYGGTFTTSSGGWGGGGGFGGGGFGGGGGGGGGAGGGF